MEGHFTHQEVLCKPILEIVSRSKPMGHIFLQNHRFRKIHITANIRPGTDPNPKAAPVSIVQIVAKELT
jgi:hypothetical protein